MNQINNRSKQLVKNSSILYVRMMFLMIIGFYTTRILLEALGVTDLGIYNVVGSLVVMFDFVSSGLTNSTQRYLNIGLGENDAEKTRQYFSQSLVLNVLIAVVLCFFAESFGLWFLYNQLVIPQERLNAAVVIYHFSVLSLFLKFLKISYEGDVIANESMSMYAYLSIIEGIGKLLICYAVIYSKSCDDLILYGGLILILNIVLTIYNILYCRIRYSESNFKLYYDKCLYKQLLSFIGINSFGVISWALGKQGINIILNMFFGPAVNGAKGLATTVDTVIAKFSTNIDIAVRPQITKLYAAGDYPQMLELTFKSTKYILLLLIIVSEPFLFRTEMILQIWLKEVPVYTAVFVQLLIFETISNTLGTSFNSVSMATGKIKNVQVLGRLITLSTLPFSYCLLKIVENPYLPVLLMVITTFVYSLYIAYDVNKTFHFGMKCYMKSVIVPIFFIFTLVLLGCYFISSMMTIKNAYVNVCVTSLALLFYSSLVSFIWGVDKNDRKKIINYIRKRIHV